MFIVGHGKMLWTWIKRNKISKLSCGKDKERKNCKDCKFQERICWINELSEWNIYNDPDNAISNFFMNDFFFFSFYNRIMYWRRNIKCSWDICFAGLWYIVDKNWTTRKYLNLLNLNGLNFNCCKFSSIYGYSHERYRKKIVCSWNTLLRDSCNTPPGHKQSHNK